MELLDKFRTGKYHDHSQDQRHENAPKQYAVLVLLRNFEIAEDKEEYEKIVDRQRELDQIAGYKLQTARRTLIIKDDAGKDHRERDSYPAPDGRFAIFDGVGAAIEESQIQTQHEKDEYRESDP